MTDTDRQKTGGGLAGRPRDAKVPGGERPAEEEKGVDEDKRLIEKLKPEISRQITGAVKRQVAQIAEEAPAPPTAAGEAVRLRRRVEDLETEVTTWKHRAHRAQILEALDRHEVTSGARDLLVDKLAASVRPGEEGDLFIVFGEDGHEVLIDNYLSGYLAARRDLVRSSARSGSGAPSHLAASPSPEGEPRELADLLRDPVTGRPTPERAERFRRENPERYAEMRTRAKLRGGFSGGTFIKAQQA